MSISTQSAPKRIIAFEVSKASLTVHLMPEDQQVVIANTPKTINKLKNSKLGAAVAMIWRRSCGLSRTGLNMRQSKRCVFRCNGMSGP